ncbi:NAD-dependent epimerase/dehydratase family protein [Paucibacter sp. M5-1]|uniref:NAD-dependent epimerase/dehydratase family protein n=1 Tax=Paucibacter sp. M5-1 TaxID=3015998 RepID=UPI003F7F6395
MRCRRLLLTGAAGGLGRVLRPRLQRHCERLRLSDLADLGGAAAHEELMPADLADAHAMLELLDGVDAVLHFGGVSVEQPFDMVLPANIVGVFNLYEAARLQGVRRIVFASSNHVTGCYRQGEVIRPTAPARPDGYYGISKAFGENLASLYFDRYGIETVSLRLGNCAPEPADRRGLAIWLSHDDLERLVLASLSAEDVGCLTIYGASDNPRAWWDNSAERDIGYRPQDSAEAYRAQIEARPPVADPQDPTELYQGGRFLGIGPFPFP